MLKLVSRFVLEVLPYALSALIAAIVVPAFLSSYLYGTQPAKPVSADDSGIRAVELVRGDYAAFAEQTGSSLSSRLVQPQLFAK